MKRIYLQKAKSSIARPTTIRDINKQIVLTYIRDRAPISRAEIARQTALQRSTVSAIVEDLYNAGLIEEIGAGDSNGGRKPTLLQIKSGKAFAIGIDLTPTETHLAVADLSGNIIEQETFDTSDDADFMSGQIVSRTIKLAEKYQSDEMEIGISLPGIVDQANSKVVFVPYFGWREWEISKQLTDATGLPVTMDNDANAIAFAELWFGQNDTHGIKNFITVLVAEGIGTGIVFEGQIYRGARGAAGEFGHMIVGTDAPVKCSCGSRNCWEAHSSERASVGRYYQLTGKKNGARKDVSFEDLIELAKSGNQAALAAIRETAKFLGIGISNLIVGLSPQAIIICGNITKIWDLIKDEVHSAAERSVRRKLPRTLIAASTLSGSPTTIGAISLVLAGKFASAN